MTNKYGKCEICNTSLQPINFKEAEYQYENGCRFPTGRTRITCSHLECPNCFKNYCVDDSFDPSYT